MYAQHFNLSSEPFGLTPDPSFLYPSAGHREALAALHVGISGGRGLIVMVGEVGTGKTTLLYSLLSAMSDDIKVAYISNTKLRFEEILKQALSDFGVFTESAARDGTHKCFTDFLLRCADEQRVAALIIDEAQNLDDDCMESLRLLSNVETYTHKLLQIVLVGQPELTAKLSSSHLRQLRERIAVYAEIKPLSWRESHAYVAHRLEQAGGSVHLFTAPALAWLLWNAGGIPRRINILCHNALLFAFGREAQRVRFGMARQATRTRLRRRRWSAPRRDRAAARSVPEAAVSRPSPSIAREVAIPPRPVSMPSRPLMMSVYLLLIAVAVGGAWWNSEAVILRPNPSATAPAGAQVEDPFSLEAHSGVQEEAGAVAEEADDQPEAIDVAAAPVAATTSAAEIEATVIEPDPAGSDEHASTIAGDAPPESARIRMMRVEEGANIWEMTKLVYGYADPPLVARVLELNPRLSVNPDHLTVGDVVMFPPPAAETGRTGDLEIGG